MNKNEIIRYENVGLSYNSKNVFSGFNLSIKKGQKILLKGKSGTGKSTLFKMLLGFEKPTDGKLYYRNLPVGPGLVWEIRKEVAYVSQESDLGEGPVRILLEEVFSYQPNRERMDSEKLHLLMRELELEEDTLDKNFENLSGGEKQRIGILIALMLGREIFLLDEATSALDSELKKKVADYFLQHGGWTLLIISHDREWENEKVKVVELKKQTVEGKHIAKEESTTKEKRINIGEG